MKLSLISVEQALQSAAEHHYPVPAPIYGPIEQALRHALSLFGPNGEYWIQGRESSPLYERRWRSSTAYAKAVECVGPTSANTYEERIVPAGTGYCVIGSLRNAPHYDNARLTFLTATGIPNIAEWNDHPQRSFSQVADAFELAISYAHSKGK